MNKGPKNTSAVQGASIEIRSSGPFTCYAMDAGKRSLILGPLNANARILKTRLPQDVDTIFVKCEKSTEWTFEWKANPNPISDLDKTPIEIGIDRDAPLSIHDEMKRFIREEVSRVAVTNSQSSFEEEDDFDIEDDLEPTSPYEMTEMQEETPIEQPITNTIPAKTEPAEPVAKPKAANDESYKEPNPEDATLSQD